jgi:nucleoside-diphosphate-sugar epimerase
MILITGATGFIGKRVASIAAKHFQKSHILCLIRDKESPLEKSGRKILGKLKLKTKKIDLVTGKGIDNIPKSPDLVIHLAANTETSEANHRVNDSGTKNLVKALGKLGPETHFIYVSTTAVMSGRKNCSIPFDENDLPSPTNEYGRTKLKAEKILIDESIKQKFKLTIFRLPTVYGKGMRKDSFFDFLKKLILKNSILIRLNWPGKTSFVHVDDVAKAIVAIIKKPPRKGKAQLLILQAESFTLGQISKMLHRELGIKYKPIKLPQILWEIAKFIRKYTYLSEKWVSSKTYNYIWRGSLIVDNVIYTKSNKILEVVPAFRYEKLKKHLEEVL